MDVGRLKKIPLFAGVSDEDLGQIAPFAAEVSASAGNTLVQEGEYSYQFMAIEEGTAEVTRDGEKVAEFGPGDFFGEAGLLQGELRNATVVATAPIRLITLSKWDMKRLEKAIPSAAEKIRAAVEERK